MELKEKLVTLRKEKGLTQLAVAEKLDVSRQAISRWESGSAMPSIENLRCLSELYGIPIDCLINNDGASETKTIQSIQMETSTTGGKKKKIILAIVLTISVVVAILIVTAHRDTKSVDFNTVGSEDWNDSETEEIPIQW